MNGTVEIPIFHHYEVVKIDHPKWGGLWCVDAILPKNLRLVDATGRTLKCDPSLVIKLEGEEAASATNEFARLRAESPDTTKTFVIGETVSLKGKPGIFVVLKPIPRGYSCALLGGDDNRYWSCPAANLTRIKITATVAE